MSTTRHGAMNTIASKIRMRRDQRAFERAVREASPTMRNELFAAASRDHFHIM